LVSQRRNLFGDAVHTPSLAQLQKGQSVSRGNQGNDRGNSFDLLRHFAALLVLFSHQFALHGLGEPVYPFWDSYGFVAVAIFFSISGYFMPASFTRSGNFIEFSKRRLRRLLPGMVVCSFLMTYVLGAIYASGSRWDYITSKFAWTTFLKYSTFLGQAIPGVFANYIYPNAVNGSLWTLPIECLCYVAIGVALSFSQSWKVMLALFVGAMLGTASLVHTGTGFSFYGVPLNYLCMFGICFSGGALLSVTKASWYPNRWLLVVFGLAGMFLMPGGLEYSVLGTFGITLIVAVVGEAFGEKLINGKFDISYGMYIYGFPIQQIVINKVTHRFWLGMAISMVLAMLAGYLSYRFVERPFLRKGRKIQPSGETAVSGLPEPVQ
jgi:peptidoglycan/LPS O-acetylase OafA/YrhL